MTPDFLILGAARCGTTSLHAWLDLHPEICMSEPKEPFFFEMQYERGLQYYRSSCFAHRKRERLTGEARHRNLYLPWVPDRIRETNPRARLIVLVRNPIDRALSHWWIRFRRGREPLHFEAAVAADLGFP